MYVTEELTMHKHEEIKSHPKVFYDETPVKVLNREVLILDDILSPGPITFIPYELMRNKTYFQKFSSTFRYFRAGLKLRIQINSNPQNYGFLLINYWPNITDISTSVYDYRNAKPHFIDVSATQSLEIEIPYINHMRWLDLADTTTQWSNITVSYQSTTYTVQTQTIPITIQVWASFVDPEFDGAWELTPPSEAQSEIVVGETPNALLNVAGALPLAVLGTSTAISAYQSVRDMVSSFVTMSTKVEAVEKTSKRISQLFKQSPETFKEPTDLRPQYIGSLASLTQVPTVTLDAYPRQKFPPCELGDPNLLHNVLEICRIPTLRHIATLGTSSVPFQIFLDPGQGDSTTMISYYDMMACMYRYWRGSIKVNIKIFTSPLISGRGILRLTNQWAVADSNPANEDETPYRKIITIKGSTEVSMTVPFIYDKWWKDTGVFTGFANDQINTLTFDIISPLTSPGDLSPQVVLVVSVAAGDDFQLRGYTCWRNATPAADSVAQSLSDEWSAKTFEPFCSLKPIDHLIDLPENDDTVELLLSRYSGRPPTVNFSVINLTPNLTDADNFDYILRMFRYWRGSVRFKCLIDWSTTPTKTYWEVMMDDNKDVDYKPTTNGISRGCAFNKNDNGAPVEFTQPYFCETEWTSQTYNLGNATWNVEPMDILPLFLSGSTIDRVLLAAGHDFQLAYLLPPFTRVSSAYA